MGCRPRRVARRLCVGRTRRAQGCRRWRASTRGRRAARSQWLAARNGRSVHVRVQQLRRGARGPWIHRVCTTQLVSRRGSLSLARPQGEYDPGDAVFVHPRTARSHPGVARLAALCCSRPHRLLWLELRRRDRRPDSSAPRQIRALDLLR